MNDFSSKDARYARATEIRSNQVGRASTMDAYEKTGMSSSSGYRYASNASPTVPPRPPVQGFTNQAYQTHSIDHDYRTISYDPYEKRGAGDGEAVHAAPISSSEYKKERRLSTRPSSPSEYPCLYPNCGYISSRAHDLKRHMTVHFLPVPEQLLDCKYEWCGRTGAHGFKRQNHRLEHYRIVHMQESDYPKSGQKGKSDYGQTTRERGVRDHHIQKASMTDRLVSPENIYKSPITQKTEESPIIGEECLDPRGSFHAEHEARLSSQQGVEVSVAVADEGDTKTLDADSVHGAEWKTTLGGSEMESCKATNWNSSPEERLLERSEDGILIELQATSDTLATMRSKLTESFLGSEAYQHSLLLLVDWDLLAFMEDQFRDHQSIQRVLGSVVTLSGTAQHAQAMTCSEYIREHWAEQGSKILDTLQDALSSPTHLSHSMFDICIEERDSFNALSSQVGIDIYVSRKQVCFLVKSANINVMVKAGQQLAWMGAALRTSTNGEIQYCEPALEQKIGREGDEPVTWTIKFGMNPLAEKDHSCWFPLFKNPVIAHGFPTARRTNQEAGLEVPVDMMAALGGARHAVDFEGGLVLKGYSTLFVPVKRLQNSVQWHLICARGEDRIQYRESSAQCPTRVLLDDLNHEELKTTRAFLGLWKEAETHLATADADYESIDWSKAKEASPSSRVTGGSLGFSKIFSVKLNFVLGAKDGPYHYSQQEPFQKTIDRAEKLPVVLYDQNDRRAWLVPALSVILHIIQLRHHIKPFIVGGETIQISPLDPLLHNNAAREAVAKNKSQKLFDCETTEENNYYFRDAILDTWSILDGPMEKEATIQATPGAAVHATWQSTIQGWEFRAVAEEERHLKQKAQILEKTAGKWYDLVKDVDAVVLFASGFGDIIRPSSESAGLCRKWQCLPKGKDYLAVCVPMLESFYAKAGHRQDHQYLTSARLQWRKGFMLFEQCVDDTADDCDCDRLQQVYRDSHTVFGDRTPPGNLEANGCVVFGQARHPLKPSTQRSRQPSSLYSLPNEHIQDSTVSRSSLMREDCIVNLDLDPRFDHCPNGNGSTRTPSPDRPLQTLTSRRDDSETEAFKPKMKRHRLPHPKSGDPDEEMHAMSIPAKATDRFELEYDIHAKSTDNTRPEPKNTKLPSYTTRFAPIIIPTVNGSTASKHLQPCQHLNGCSCRSRFTAGFESRQPFVHMAAKSGSELGDNNRI